MAGFQDDDLDGLAATIEALTDIIGAEELAVLNAEMSKALQTKAMIEEAKRIGNGEALALARFLYSDLLKTLSARVAAITKAAH